MWRATRERFLNGRIVRRGVTGVSGVMPVASGSMNAAAAFSTGARYASDVIALEVFWRLHYKLIRVYTQCRGSSCFSFAKLDAAARAIAAPSAPAPAWR
jgi:hypothetical protein